MKVAYLGNFTAAFCTEQHVAQSLESLGHEVTRLQEGQVRARDVPDQAADHDLLIWTQTYPLAEAGGTVEERAAMLQELRARGIPTAGFHLDRWWGLARETQIEHEPFFRVDALFTADGGHDVQWAEAGITHIWSPPAVYHAECEPVEPLPRYSSDLAFVGSWRGAYHPEWKHRHALINHLRRRYGRRAVLWPRVPGQPVRGKALAHLYASVKILIGDSCLVGAPSRYFSDRIPETLGRGGFLLHPYVEGIEHLYTDGKHLRFWPLDDWGELDRLIAYYLEHEDERREIAAEGRRHVLEHHTYRHRMQMVLDYMSEHHHVSRRGWPGELRQGTLDAAVWSEIYEQDVYRAAEWVVPGSVVVDVGANVGMFTHWAQARGARVTAVEPSPENLVQLHRNVDGVEIIEAAVGSLAGRARMVYPADPLNRSGAASTENDPGGEVEVLPLGDVLPPEGDVDVLKIDVEGAEYEALLAAPRAVLERCRFITIEFHNDVGLFGDLVRYLAETHSLQIIGRPSAGGYIYARRY